MTKIRVDVTFTNSYEIEVDDDADLTGDLPDVVAEQMVPDGASLTNWDWEVIE